MPWGATNSLISLLISVHLTDYSTINEKNADDDQLYVLMDLNMDIMRQSVCLVVNPILVNSLIARCFGMPNTQ